MKKLQIGLALLLAGLFTAANAADSCPGVFLLNGSGSPPVVTGTTIQYSLWGPSPGFYVYFDGLPYYVADPDPNSPPGAYFNVGYVIASPISYGNHTLRVSWDPCVLNYSNAPPSSIVDYVNVTVGYGGAAWGFWAGYWGSVSPTATSNGKTYQYIADNYSYVTHTGGASFGVCGFSSNPGPGWLANIAVGSTTKLGSAATYTYASGCASWSWNNGNVGVSSGVVQVVVTHY